MARDTRSLAFAACGSRASNVGCVGQGEHLARLGVHDDREAESPRASSTVWRSTPLGVPLEVEVDGGVQVLAVDRRLDGGLAERDPVADADGVALRAVGAREQAVEVALEAGQRPRRCP